MTHAEFLAGYRAGRLRLRVDTGAAAKFVSARLMLPLVLLPLFGIAVGAALVGHLYVGIALFVLTVALRFLVRRSGHGFVATRALSDPAFFAEALARRVIRVEGAGDAGAPSGA